MEFKIEDKNEKIIMKFLENKFLQFVTSDDKEQAKKELSSYVLASSWRKHKKRISYCEIKLATTKERIT